MYIRLAIVVIVLINLSACNSEEVDTPSSESQTVDSRFVTAQALIDYNNEISAADPVDFRAGRDLIYTENALQERILRRLKAQLPILDLSTTVRYKFKEPIIEGTIYFSTEPLSSPARIVENTGGRAEAINTGYDGLEHRSYLIKVGDRWWFSGKTLELDSRENTDPQYMLRLEEHVALFAAVATELLPRVNKDEFATIEQFREAFDEAGKEHVQQYPNKFRNLFGDD